MDIKIYFDTDKELQECAAEWMRRLGLGDWWITCCLVGIRDMEDQELAGHSDVQHVNRGGTISILRKEDIPDTIIKTPHELTLIHELLHFKFVGFEESRATVEGVFFDLCQHQLLEDMAKALFMAKYGLERRWFANDADVVQA